MDTQLRLTLINIFSVVVMLGTMAVVLRLIKAPTLYRNSWSEFFWTLMDPRSQHVPYLAFAGTIGTIFGGFTGYALIKLTG